jgi:hypothetical protein
VVAGCKRDCDGQNLTDGNKGWDEMEMETQMEMEENWKSNATQSQTVPL